MRSFALTFIPMLVLMALFCPGGSAAMSLGAGSAAEGCSVALDVEIHLAVSESCDAEIGIHPCRGWPHETAIVQPGPRPVDPVVQELATPLDNARGGVTAMRIVARIAFNQLERWLARNGL